LTDLFSSYPNLGLSNRIVMPAMSRHSTLSRGVPTPELAAYYLRRAENGVGLIIIEGAAVDSAASRAYVGGLEFHSALHVESWRPIVDRIHTAGAKVWLQLYHAGRLTTAEVNSCRPLSPSPLPPFSQESAFMVKRGSGFVHFQTGTPFTVPAEMTLEEIAQVQRSFADSTRLAMRAGFDGVELHGAHGYLLYEFSSALTNQRKDEYGPGGDQYRFARETVALCRDQLTPGKFLCYRLSLHMVDLVFARQDPAVMDFGHLVRQIDASVDAFHCSELKAGQPLFGGSLTLSNEVRKASAKPIITCGGIRDRIQGETLLAAASTDLVAYGRSLIANPDLARLMRDEEPDRMVPFRAEIHLQSVV
jgi:2,4-dienoyl-CoA reductase-like NADH-dependent reductase (Old Yellow Enzyme family)